jgi:hypothetical protein
MDNEGSLPTRIFRQILIIHGGMYVVVKPSTPFDRGRRGRSDSCIHSLKEEKTFLEFREAAPPLGAKSGQKCFKLRVAAKGVECGVLGVEWIARQA